MILKASSVTVATTFLPGLLVAGLGFAFYAPVLPPLVKEWYEHENFSYGFLIPFIFVYLLWREREALRELRMTPAGWGVVSLALTVLLGLVGAIVGEPFLSRLSFVFAIGAFIHLFFGSQGVKRLAFPIAYLFLMVPPPYFIVKELSYYLRMFDAFMAAHLLQMAGIPIFLDAHLLHLPTITLEVADVCSGTASLFAMIALGTLYAYYLPVNATAKTVLLLAAVIFPVIANLFRIFLVGYAVYHFGPVMLAAFFHQFTGTFTFLLSLLMMLLTGAWLARRCPQEGSVGAAMTAPELPSQPPGREGKNAGLSIPVLAAASVFLVALYLSNIEISRPLRPSPDLNKLPIQLGNFQMRSGEWPDAYVDPNSDIFVSRIYQSPRGDPIELFVGYKGLQWGSNRLRSPRLVFPVGWEYASIGDIAIERPGGEPIKAIELTTKKGSAKRAVLYWYEVRGSSFAGDLRNRLELIAGFFSSRRTDGAVVRLATSVGEAETMKQAMQRLISFAVLLEPAIRQFLPVE